MSKAGDLLHRAAFNLLSCLPTTGSRRLLSRYFDWWHRRPDPWGYTSDQYELDRHTATLERLPPRDYRRILDVGCSEGAFTDLMARRYPRAETIGMDISSSAVHRAMSRATSPARFIHLDIRSHVPGGSFDLVVCTEVLYYIGVSATLGRVSRRLSGLLMPGGVLALAHPWPESRQLHRHVAEDPTLTALSEAVIEDGSRPYAVCLFERRRASGSGGLG